MEDWVEKKPQSQQMRRKAAQRWLLDVIAIPHNSKQPWLPREGQARQNPNTLKALPLEYELLGVTLLWKHEYWYTPRA